MSRFDRVTSRDSLLVALAASALAAAAFGAGCSSSPAAPTGFGANVTVDARALSASALGSLHSARLNVTGAQTLTKTLEASTIATLKKDKELRFRFVPASTVKAGDSLGFSVDVLDDGGAVVSTGSFAETKLPATALAVLIKLAGSSGDGGPGDGSGKVLGVDCAEGTECASGFCADGVCCNEACDGVCVSCKAVTKGMCKEFAVDTDPEMECLEIVATAPAEPDAGAGGDASGDASAGEVAGDGPVAEAGPSEAGASEAGASDASFINTPDGGFMTTAGACGGKCSGARACKYPDKTKSCGKAFCNSKTDVGSFACNGAGSCNPELTACTSFSCDEKTGACKTQCADNADCAGGKYCNGTTSMCAPKKGNGISCLNGGECATGNCIGAAGTSVCCNTACEGAGLSCTTGQCVCPGVTCGAGVACQVYFQDADNDGFGNKFGAIGAGSLTAKAGCAGAPPAGYVADNTDCDDGDPRVHPGQTTFYDAPSLGAPHTFDYDCNGTFQKETPEYPGGVCRFCGAVGTCSATTTTCSSANQSASYQCPQETLILRAVSGTTSATVPDDDGIRMSLAAPSTALTPYAGPSDGTTVIPTKPCTFCLPQCCGCYDNDKIGFKVAVACGDPGTTYTCGSCSVAGGTASAAIAGSKKQKCR